MDHHPRRRPQRPPADRPRRPDSRERLDTVVFDLGAVLIDWNPRHLYRTLFSGPDGVTEMEAFLATVCTPAWNLEQDRGRSLAAATESLIEAHPQHAALIEAYYERWEEMVGEPIEGSVRIAHELKSRGTRLIALSNWSAETFPRAKHKLGFLDEFDGVLISGEVGLVKPDPEIFELCARRHGIDVRHAVFIDDSPRNVEGAARAGFDAIVFSSPGQLRHDLTARGLLDGAGARADVDLPPARGVEGDE